MRRIQGVLTMVGVLCLLTLMVFVLGNDIFTGCLV